MKKQLTAAFFIFLAGVMTGCSGIRTARTYSYTNADYGTFKIPSCDADNEYVAKIRAGGVPDNVYPGSVIIKTENGWLWYYEPEDTKDTSAYRYVGTPDDAEGLSEEESGAVLDEIDVVFQKYVDKVDAGELTVIDLDGDGQIQYAEAIIESFYFLSDEQEKPYYGLVDFLGYESVLW